MDATSYCTLLHCATCRAASGASGRRVNIHGFGQRALGCVSGAATSTPARALAAAALAALAAAPVAAELRLDNNETFKSV